MVMMIETDEPRIRRFVSEHSIAVSSIRSQPFLGSDVVFQKKDNGWEILLYPRVFGSRVGDLLVLASLASIQRQEKPWFSLPSSGLFQDFLDEEVVRRAPTDQSERNLIDHDLWGLYASFCFAFELRSLLDGEYFTLDDLRDLASYLSAHFITITVASQFLAAMAVLRSVGGAVSLFQDELLTRKQYGMLQAVDTFEAALAEGGFESEAVLRLFNLLVHVTDVDVGEELTVVARKTLGSRDEETLEYDLALSFAGEDRLVAEALASEAREAGFKVFYDRYEQAGLWGKDLYAHLTDVYSKRARFCLMIISSHYAEKQWTNHERRAAQARAFSASYEYILPLRLDDTTIPGLLPTTGFIDLRTTSLEEVARVLLSKLKERR